MERMESSRTFRSDDFVLLGAAACYDSRQARKFVITRYVCAVVICCCYVNTTSLSVQLHCADSITAAINQQRSAHNRSSTNYPGEPTDVSRRLKARPRVMVASGFPVWLRGWLKQRVQVRFAVQVSDHNLRFPENVVRTKCAGGTEGEGLTGEFGKFHSEWLQESYLLL